MTDMAHAAVDFDAPDFAARIGEFSQDELARISHTDWRIGAPNQRK